MGLFRKDDYDKGLKAFKADKIDEAIMHWQNGADKGNPLCMLSLGSLYSNPVVGRVDEKRAFSYYLMAAEHGNKHGLLNAGERLVNGNGTQKDTTRGLEMLRRAQKEGLEQAKRIADEVEKIQTKAQSDTLASGEDTYALAQRYLNGDGVKEDYDLFFEMLCQAAKKGHLPAIKDMGDCYLHGIKVDKNISEAFRHYKLAAQEGYAPAQYMMALFYFNGAEGIAKDETEGLRWLKMAADGGCSDAQLLLGTRYVSGQGVPRNQELGFNYVRQAAEQANPKARLHLGHYYYYGIGTEKNYEAADYNLSLAYSAGEREATLLLGDIRIFHSSGSKQDYLKGFKYFEEAEKANLPGASFSLGYCYACGHGTNRMPDRAINYYSKALADPRTHPQQYIDACNNMAMLYCRGDNDIRDLDKGIKYFQESARRGDDKAPLYLGLLYYYGVKENGKEVMAKDDSVAYIYLKLALERGNEKAARYLKSDLSGLLPRYKVGLEEKVASVFENFAAELFDNLISRL